MRKISYVIGRLSESDLSWLVKAGVYRALPGGTVVIAQGKPSDALYIVLSGEMLVTVVTEGQKKTLGTVGCGELLGELSFLDRRPPSATVTVVQPATVLAVPRTVLSSHLEADAPFAAHFYQALGVMLAYRVRQNLNPFRAGKPLDETSNYDDELDTDLLDEMAVAERRFSWLLEYFGNRGRAA
jgi:CRP-like cAMP-binding protein